jgi:cobalt-zinc-cadmium efflux system protein
MLHAIKNFGTAFAIGTALNLGFVIVEVIYGLLANSMALASSRCGPQPRRCAGVVMAWIATLLAGRAAVSYSTARAISSSCMPIASS